MKTEGSFLYEQQHPTRPHILRHHNLILTFTAQYRPGRLWGPPNFLYNGYRVKRQVHEADHTAPISAEVEKTWIYSATPLFVFMA
jgi:hypothetical protein